jgi:aconitate hydratase
MARADAFGARTPLPGAGGIDFYRLARLHEQGIGDPSRLPVTVRILLENLLRHSGESYVEEGDVEALARWDGQKVEPTGGNAGVRSHSSDEGWRGGAPPTGRVSAQIDKERAFMPARVLLQDFTGVPAVVDLAAMRSAMARAGGDPSRIDPLSPADLVVDHSVQVDMFGTPGSYQANIEREYERNRERYELLRWAQQAFHGFSVVPPGMGIVHQINL